MRRFRSFAACLMLFGLTDPAAHAAEPVSLHYRSPELGPALRPLTRTAILMGPTELRAVVIPPYELERVRVLSDAVLMDGRRGELCRSGAREKDRCEFDFGSSIGGHALTFLIQVRSAPDRPLETWTRRIVTLRSSARRSAEPGLPVLMEHADSRSHPNDYVTRAARVLRTVGTGRSVEEIPVLDLSREDFRATADGLGEIDIVSLQAPDVDTPCVIPLVWNVAPYLKAGRAGLSWNDDHAAMVQRVREGFRTAARKGLECECLVVEFTAFARPLFGPFRLHGGPSLDDDERETNQRILTRLEAHLLEDPPRRWLERPSGPRGTIWGADFRSVYQTLNDLLRGYPGVKHLLLMTDGNEEPAGARPKFRHELWPGRIADLNRPWAEDDLAAFLEGLDNETRWYDPLVTEFISRLAPDDPDAENKIGRFVNRLDPGGLASLHPHRKDVWPPVDVLVVPSARTPKRRPRSTGFLPVVSGELWTLAAIRTPGETAVEAEPAQSEVRASLTVDEALLRVQERVRSSYVVELVVPNPGQDMQPHPIELRLRETAGERIRIESMSAYFSSPPLSRKMPNYASSPFKVLRMLAAHHLREYPFDDRYHELLRRRWTDETDEQVRALLFESWVSIQLQRLQAGDDNMSKRRCKAHVREAFKNLAGLTPQNRPDPVLAATARRAAELYRARFPESFAGLD